MATVRDTSPKTSDNRIHDEICRQFEWQSDIQSEEIKIEVDDSVVVLSGHVEACLDRLEAEKAAKAVNGVTSVINKIKVEPKHPRTDSEIADDVVASLRMVSTVLEELPTVSVQEGVAFLRGEVRWKFQRESAEKAADAVIGVRQVVDLIEVVPCSRPISSRHVNRIRMDTKPSAESHNESQPETTSRPLFVVPSPIGRA